MTRKGDFLNTINKMAKILATSFQWQSWPLECAKVKFKYANRKPIFDFIVDIDSYQFRDIHSPNVGDFDLDH